MYTKISDYKQSKVTETFDAINTEPINSGATFVPEGFTKTTLQIAELIAEEYYEDALNVNDILAKLTPEICQQFMNDIYPSEVIDGTMGEQRTEVVSALVDMIGL